MSRKLPVTKLTLSDAAKPDQATSSPEQKPRKLWICLYDADYANHEDFTLEKRELFRKAVIIMSDDTRPLPDGACGKFEMDQICTKHYWASDDIFKSMLKAFAENVEKDQNIEYLHEYYPAHRAEIEKRMDALAAGRECKPLQRKVGDTLLQFSKALKAWVEVAVELKGVLAKNVETMQEAGAGSLELAGQFKALNAMVETFGGKIWPICDKA